MQIHLNLPLNALSAWDALEKGKDFSPLVIKYRKMKVALILIMLLQRIVSAQKQTLRCNKQKRNSIFMSRVVAKVAHHKRQCNILKDTMEGMLCCRGMF